MKRFTFADRLRYGFDNLMAKGTATLIIALFLVSALLVFLVSAILALASSEGSQLGVGALMWMGMLRTLDPGTMGGDQGGPLFLMGMFIITMGGIFMVGSLIGILTNGLDTKLEELRKGRSPVVENNHTVILGWSPQIYAIIAELVAANSNQPRSCIAILAEKDKIEMEDDIRNRVGPTGRTRVVCRSGSPLDLADLLIVNPHSARSIVILSDETGNADTRVIKTILAITNHPQRRPDPYHIVTEIRDQLNLEAARLVARGEAQLILVDDLIARITAQTCRQSGLSVVYTELLDFNGDEIYIKEEPALVGKTFGEVILAYERSAVIGLQLPDGTIQLNPPGETLVNPGCKVVAISQDDNTILPVPGGKVVIDHALVRERKSPAPRPESTLILGWNRRGPMIVRELDHYVAPGSQVTVVADLEQVTTDVRQCCIDLQNQTLAFIEGNTSNRAALDSLNITQYNHVITLGYSDRMDEQDADARTLVTLLHLRDLADQANHTFSIVSEMLDTRNRELAEVTRVDDFIVSDKFVSLLISQTSENKDLAIIFQDLFDPEGSELYLKPAVDYVELGKPVNFYTVVEAARCRGEVAIGYCIGSESKQSAKSYGIHVNPQKSLPVTYQHQDRIIVLAES